MYFAIHVLCVVVLISFIFLFSFLLFSFILKAAVNESAGTSPCVSHSTEAVAEDYSGCKCRVPFSHQWGEMTYHNAMVLHTEHTSGSEPMVL